MGRGFLAGWLVVLVAASAEASPASARERAAVRLKVLSRAQALVGKSTLAKSGFTDDCSGFARAAFQAANIDLFAGPVLLRDNGVTGIWRTANAAGALHRRAPAPGDLVFFRETYDRNRDGLRNDGLTHVGVVEEIEPDGTLTFIHRSSTGVTRAKANLASPAVHRAPTGELLNDYLRVKSASTRAYLTGELFAGFASADALAAPVAPAPPRLSARNRPPVRRAR